MAHIIEQKQRKNLQARLKRDSETQEEKDVRRARGRAYDKKHRDNWTLEKIAERAAYNHARWPTTGSKQRGLGCIKLFPNPFPLDVKIHWHHVIDRIHIVSVPAHIHSKAGGNISLNLHHQRMENFLFETYGLQPKVLVAD